MRFALRSLLKSPGFTAVALLTLALGIGVNTSMFSVLRTLLLRTLSYAESDRLVRVHRTTPRASAAQLSAANFLDYRTQNSVFEHFAAFEWAGFSLTDPGQPAEWLRGMRVTADFFPLLKTPPAIGRVFAAEEDQPGRNQVIVLSHAFWVGRYARDPAIVGRQIRLNGESVTVIGVMPPSFDDQMLWGVVDGWRPMAFSDAQRFNRGLSFLNVIARLKSDVTLQQAQSAMDTVAERFATAYPEHNAKSGIRLAPLAYGSQGDDDGQITLLVTALAAFVLLIACANLANLQFARTAARARENAIRAALGASRTHIMRLALSESLLLSFVGGLLGLLVAMWINDALGRQFIINGQSGLPFPMDWRSLGFTLIVSGATGLAFGLLPAWLASRINLNDALQQGTRGSTGARTQHRIRHGLIVIEVALALMLLASSALFFGGLNRFAQRDPGWRIDGLLKGYVTINPPVSATTPELRLAYRRNFVEQVTQRLASIPGVDQVAFGRGIPTWGYGGNSTFAIEGRPTPLPGLEPSATMPSVSPEFFDILNLRLIRGRTFAATDRADTPTVVVINETMARTFWPGENPVGRRIGGGTDPTNAQWWEIIGVVADARAAASVGEPGVPFQVYRAWTQFPQGGGTIILQTRLTPEALAPELRRAVAGIDPDLPLRDISTIRHDIEEGLANLQLAGWTLAAIALLGLLLAAIGIYGVIANYVVQRTKEIGIRMALGAQARDVHAIVLGLGLRLALIGAALGLAGSFGISRLLTSIMPALPAADIATNLATTALLIGIALLACWLPARRATKVDPMVALRAE